MTTQDNLLFLIETMRPFKYPEIVYQVNILTLIKLEVTVLYELYI